MAELCGEVRATAIRSLERHQGCRFLRVGELALTAAGFTAKTAATFTMKWISLTRLSCFASLCLVLCSSAGAASKAELVEVTKIWDQAGHSAFTDLTRFKGRWYCVFREGQGHVSAKGDIRVLSSRDGKEWASAALIEQAGYDLRDPKITVHPDGKRLVILGGATVREGTKPATESQSFTTFSNDGKRWGDLKWAGPTNNWLWRITWRNRTAYGVAYDVTPASRAEKKYGTRLFSSKDGVRFDTVSPDMGAGPGATEATVRFARDGTAYCLQRRDGKPANTALLGDSRPPYTHWEWRDLGEFFGGPDFIQIPDGRWIAVGRLMQKDATGKAAARTVVCELDMKQGKLNPLLTLPSGGDTSYPGLAWHRGLLWMSYYSSHEGKTSIYMAKVRL
jgi:hypothetical protein